MKGFAINLQALSLIILIFALMMTASSMLSAQSLTTFSSEYSASANGIKAKAFRSLKRLDDGGYQFENTLTAEFAGTTLATLIESSQFKLVGQSIIPAHYQYSLTGISDDSKVITFDWPALLAVSSKALKSWTIELTNNTQDPLSYQLVLAQYLANHTGSLFEIPIIDGADIEIQRFKIIAEEVLDSAIGRLDCVIVERIKDDDDKRTTTIWFAKDHSYLLAKLKQTTAGGLTISLELESAVIGELAL
ncbi:MAG: hypothetical protein ACI9E4_001156 [Pseudohongiellaceae bacterium]|jgi:hypothetical protein